jgi:hypothetical protein
METVRQIEDVIEEDRGYYWQSAKDTPTTACYLLSGKISFFLILKKFVQI